MIKEVLKKSHCSHLHHWSYQMLLCGFLAEYSSVHFPNDHSLLWTHLWAALYLLILSLVWVEPESKQILVLEIIKCRISPEEAISETGGLV